MDFHSNITIHKHICSPGYSTNYHLFFLAGLGRGGESAGAPNDNFRKNICSEDDFRSRIFGTFVVKFLACLPLLTNGIIAHF